MEGERPREPHEDARLIIGWSPVFAETILLRLAWTLALHVSVLEHV